MPSNWLRFISFASTYHAVENSLPPGVLVLLDRLDEELTVLRSRHLQIDEILIACLIKRNVREEDFGLGRVHAVDINFDCIYVLVTCRECKSWM